MRILIRETAQHEDGGFQAEISFDDAAPYPIDVSDPFAPEEEARLAWYFEGWLSFPFTDQVLAAQAAASVEEYGHRLFRQIFEGFPDVLAEYKMAVRAAGGYGDLHVQVAGSPAFHALHWEALKDPMHPRPFAVEAPLLRKNLHPPNFQARLRPSPTLNVLLVTARPGWPPLTANGPFSSSTAPAPASPKPRRPSRWRICCKATRFPSPSSTPASRLCRPDLPELPGPPRPGSS